MTLFDECIQALGDKAEILSIEESNKLFDNLVETFAVTSWGRINWDIVASKALINDISEIEVYLRGEFRDNFDEEVYLLWNYSDAPVVKTRISQVITVIDDVTAVGSDTWVFNPIQKYVIEFFHEGEVILGMK